MKHFESPFNSLDCDLSHVFLARQRNDLSLLRHVFKSLTFKIDASKEVNLYFLEFSNYELIYDVAKVERVLKQLDKPIANDTTGFPPILIQSLPPNTAKALKILLKSEVARCFNLCFTQTGKLQPWLEQLFEPGQLFDLSEQFGSAAVKLELFNAFFLRYCELLQSPVDIPCEQACSDVIKGLIVYEIQYYRNFSESLICLERLLLQIDNSYKVKSSAMLILKKMDEGFFSNQFLADQRVQSVIDALCNVIEAPHNKEALCRLDTCVSQLMVQTKNIFWLDCLALISVFIGSFLLVGGIVGLVALASVPLSAAYLASGLMFFGGSICAFQKGQPNTLTTELDYFSQQAEQIAISVL